MTVRILMCGEGGSNLELYRASLVDEGYEVLVQEGREAALEALAADSFDLVIVDLEAPGEEALAFVQELKGAGSWEVAAVLKEPASAEEALALREVGVRELLTRPFSMTKLALTVERVLERERMTADLESPSASGAWSSSSPGGDSVALEAELARLRRRLGQAEMDSTRLEGLNNRLDSMKALVRKKDQEIGLLQSDLEVSQNAVRHHEGLQQRLQEEHQETMERQEQRLEAHRNAREAAEEEVRKLLGDLEQRSQQHVRQLENLAQDHRAVQAGFENHIQEHTHQLELLSRSGGVEREGYQDHLSALKKEMGELQGRYAHLLKEKDELLSRIDQDRGASRSLEQNQHTLESTIKDLERERDDLHKRLKTEARKHGNEVKVLIRERKKLVDETRRISKELSAKLEKERKARKQTELEIEGMKVDLPQERRKVHALVEYQRSLTENVLAGILTVDTSGIITLGNDLAGEYLEVNLSDLLGAHVEQCEAFAALRPLFAEALAEGKAGPVEFDISSGVTLRANATKVPFGPRELVLFSVIGPDKVEVPSEQPLDLDSGPLASLGAAVAGNISDVQDYAVEIRGYLERLYGTTGAESPAREDVSGALRKCGELIDFLRDIIEQAESYLS
jgi:DNA-binding response OmpR family regulator